MAAHIEYFNSYTNYLSPLFQQEHKHMFVLCDIFDARMGVAASGCTVSVLMDVSDVEDLIIRYDFAFFSFSN
jgi:hypothetical protein